jgi:hypothetical protein
MMAICGTSQLQETVYSKMGSGRGSEMGLSAPPVILREVTNAREKKLSKTNELRVFFKRWMSEI